MGPRRGGGGRAAMRRLEEILETNPEITDEAASPAIHALKEGIEFRNVSFAYERQKNGHSALEGINFTLPVGRSVGRKTAQHTAGREPDPLGRLCGQTVDRVLRREQPLV